MRRGRLRPGHHLLPRLAVHPVCGLQVGHPGWAAVCTSVPGLGACGQINNSGTCHDPRPRGASQSMCPHLSCSWPQWQRQGHREVSRGGGRAARAAAADGADWCHPTACVSCNLCALWSLLLSCPLAWSALSQTRMPIPTPRSCDKSSPGRGDQIDEVVQGSIAWSCDD